MYITVLKQYYIVKNYSTLYCAAGLPVKYCKFLQQFFTVKLNTIPYHMERQYCDCVSSRVILQSYVQLKIWIYNDPILWMKNGGHTHAR